MYFLISTISGTVCLISYLMRQVQAYQDNPNFQPCLFEEIVEGICGNFQKSQHLEQSYSLNVGPLAGSTPTNREIKCLTILTLVGRNPQNNLKNKGIFFFTALIKSFNCYRLFSFLSFFIESFNCYSSLIIQFIFPILIEIVAHSR